MPKPQNVMTTGIFNCAVCGKRFATPWRTDSQYHYKHIKNSKEYRFCSYTCTRAWQRENLQQHDQQDPKEKPCTRCGRMILSRHKLCDLCRSKAKVWNERSKRKREEKNEEE